MKHIGWCIDNIQVASGRVPKFITSDDLKKKAKNAIDDVHKYLNTLIDLVHNDTFEKAIHELEHAPIEGIRLQTHEVKELFKDLNSALYIIDLTLKELTEILNLKVISEYDAKRWRLLYQKIMYMTSKKFCDEHYMLNKEFEVSLHTKKQLQKMVRSEEHLAEFLK